MGVLGKDLFDMERPFTHIKVQFGASGYWVESYPDMQPYGTILAELLDFDLIPLEEALDRAYAALVSGDREQLLKAYLSLSSEFGTLPLYRLRRSDRFLMGEMGTAELKDLVRFCEKIGFVGYDQFFGFLQNDFEMLLNFVPLCIRDILAIQRRYKWFLESMVQGFGCEKKKGQRKEPLTVQIRKNFLEPFVSGVSLGEDREVDAPQVSIQYEVKEISFHEAELVEKLYFDRLLDFAYVELMRGIQRGFFPRRCANCGRWFVQENGATYAYCDGPAPGVPGKTCRDVGAAVSFKEKVQNNEIWQIHQRAYKKYFARTKKGTMSKTEFERWSREASRLRDEALKKYNRVEKESRKAAIVEGLRRELNRE